MGGKVSLPVTVEIGFGAGPLDASITWTDVSGYVQRSKTIACNRSVDSQTMTPGDGRGQLRLKNTTAGDFTPGRTGAYGTVRNRLPIRIRQASTTVWTGLIEKWSSGVDGIRPVVDLTLVDRWPRMKLRTLTGDRVLQVCQALGAENLWPLTDPAGIRATNATSSQWVLLSQSAPVQWAAAENPIAGLMPVVRCATGAGSAMDISWDGPGAASPGLYPAAVSWSAWIRCGSATHWAQVMVDDLGGDGISVVAYQDHLSIDANSLGISSFGAPVTLTTSAAWRHVALTAEASGSTVTLRAYVDGVLAATKSGTRAGWSPMRVWLVQGVGADIGYAGTWERTLTAAEVATIAAAGLNALGQTGQTPDARSGLVAAMWPPTTLTTRGTFAATMSKQAIDGVSQADLLAACAVTEAGMLHISTDGWPVLSSRGYRSGVALAATIPADVIDSSAQWELDDTQLANVATVERMALDQAASTVSRRNDPSVGLYGEVSRSVQGWWDTDTQAVDRANAEVNIWDLPSPGSKSFTVDLMTCGAAISPATLLAVDIGSRIRLTGLPSQTPTQTAAGWWVDGIDDQITEASWKRTFTVSPAIDFLRLDAPTFGGLDQWPLG